MEGMWVGEASTYAAVEASNAVCFRNVREHLRHVQFCAAGWLGLEPDLEIVSSTSCVVVVVVLLLGRAYLDCAIVSPCPVSRE